MSFDELGKLVFNPEQAGDEMFNVRCESQQQFRLFKRR